MINIEIFEWKRKRAASLEPIVLEKKQQQFLLNRGTNLPELPLKRYRKDIKKIRTNAKSLPLNLSDVADADTVNYNEDVNIQDVNLNRNTILTTKKISNKYKNIRRKIKRAVSPEPIILVIKKIQNSFFSIEEQISQNCS